MSTEYFFGIFCELPRDVIEPRISNGKIGNLRIEQEEFQTGRDIKTGGQMKGMLGRDQRPSHPP